MKTPYIPALICSLLLLVQCTQQQNQRSKPLDIKEYLTLVNGDAIYPNEQQLALLREVVPKEPYQPAPAYTHRTYWEDFGQTDLGKYYLEDAEALIERDPEVPISDEIFGEPQSHHKIKY